MESLFEKRENVYTLDDEETTFLHICFIRRKKSPNIHSFAVVLTHQTEMGDKLIFRADGSENERTHVHYFFQKPAQKEYQNRPIHSETIVHYAKLVRENWSWYVAQYKQNYI